MPPPVRHASWILLGVLATGLLVAPAAHAVQASGTLVLKPSKQTGLVEGEEITVDVYVRNTSTSTPNASAEPTLSVDLNPATLTGPISIVSSGDRCCGGPRATDLKFVPGSTMGCVTKGPVVASCTEGAPGEVLIIVGPGPLPLPDGAPVFLATIRFKNTAAPPSTLSRVELSASTGTCAITSCVISFPPASCVSGAAAGGAFIVGMGGDASTCPERTCGNGVVDADETCDDCNLVDGDGCDSNCTPTRCGNGIVTPGESCDDGNLDPDDGCDECGVGICPSGHVFTGARLRLNNPDGPESHGSVRFTGEFDCEDCTIDPLAFGLQIRIDIPPGGPLLDLTQRNLPIPGAEGLGCDPDDGWRVSSEGNTFTYRNTSDALVAADCAPGSAQGLRTIEITTNPGRKKTAVRVLADRATPLRIDGPLRLGIVFGSDIVRAGLCSDPHGCPSKIEFFPQAPEKLDALHINVSVPQISYTPATQDFRLVVSKGSTTIYDAGLLPGIPSVGDDFILLGPGNDTTPGLARIQIRHSSSNGVGIIVDARGDFSAAAMTDPLVKLAFTLGDQAYTDEHQWTSINGDAGIDSIEFTLTTRPTTIKPLYFVPDCAATSFVAEDCDKTPGGGYSCERSD